MDPARRARPGTADGPQLRAGKRGGPAYALGGLLERGSCIRHPPSKRRHAPFASRHDLTEGSTKQLDCITQLLPIRDALAVRSGKWKVLLLSSVRQGNQRFSASQKSILGLHSKVLAEELSDLEAHQLLARTVHNEYPVSGQYRATAYARLVKKVRLELHAWEMNDRQQMLGHGLPSAS